MTTIELLAAVALAAVVGWIALAPVFLPGRLAGEAWAPEEAPDLLETPRGRALAALRELEFDRATGKIGEADYAELSARYTAEAVAALRAEEPASDGPDAPADAEALIAARAAVLVGGPSACPTCGPRPEADARFCSTCGTTIGGGACGGCAAPLTAGARFCVECGAPVG